MRRALYVTAIVALLAAVGAPAAAGGGGCHQPDTSAATTRVVLKANCFGPTVAHVAAGDKISFANADEWDHTVTGAGFWWGSATNLAPGGVLDATFDNPGVYPYVCLLHPGMLGAVVVDGAAPTPAASPPIATKPEPVLAADTASFAVLEPAPTSGTSWAFALGLALLATIIGVTAGATTARNREG